MLRKDGAKDIDVHASCMAAPSEPSDHVQAESAMIKCFKRFRAMAKARAALIRPPSDSSPIRADVIFRHAMPLMLAAAAAITLAAIFIDATTHRLPD